MSQFVDLIWEDRHFQLDGKAFHPRIFEAATGEEVHEGFNAVRVKLDASLQSSLQWEKELQWAQDCADQGLYLFWELDLGVPRKLAQPLADEAQFRALGLAIEHFSQCITERFAAQTLGVCLYRGALDLSGNFPWDVEQEENLRIWLEDREQKLRERKELEKTADGRYLLKLFCRDAMVEFLELLSTRLPHSVLAFAILDARAVLEEGSQAELLSREAWEHIHPVVRGAKAGHELLAWEDGDSTLGFIGRRLRELPQQAAPIQGVCLPAREKTSFAQQQKLSELLAKIDGPYRFIPEANLIFEWDGLDELYVIEEGVSVQGQRKLDGFRAAGGSTKLFS